MSTTRIKTTDLRPGMRLAGRQQRTIQHVSTHVVDGDGEFDDYVICTVYLEQTTYAPGRGTVPQHAQFGPDDLHTIILDDQETP